MKDAPLLRGPLAIRVVLLFIGLVIVAVAIVCMLESELGLPPWDVLHQGISEHTPLSLGNAAIVVGLVIVAVSWIAGVPPGFGTIANAIVIGAAIDILVAIPWVDSLSGTSLPVRIGLVAAGNLLFGVDRPSTSGQAWARARGLMMLVLTRRTGWRIGRAGSDRDRRARSPACCSVAPPASGPWRSHCSWDPRSNCRSGRW